MLIAVNPARTTIRDKFPCGGTSYRVHPKIQ